MLVDPITVAANSPSPALTFAMVKTDGYGSERWDVPNKYSLSFSHATSPKTGERHYMQLRQTVSATDPITGGTSNQVASASLAVSVPPFGWTAATKAALVQALLDTLNDSDVTIAKFLTSQS
jgi:hypothetical protein